MKRTYMNTKIGNRLCIRLTSDDMDIAMPMMIASILMLLAVAAGVC